MTLGDRIVAMKDGVIHQADTPLVTYNHPRNRFVAGFIGMPPMNFFDGAIKVIDGRMVFEEGTTKSRLGKPPHPKPCPPSTGGEGTREDAGIFNGELTLPGIGFRLTVPVWLREALSGRVGQHVVLGIRPEHLHRMPVGDDENCCPLQMKLNVIEPLGNDMDVYMQTNLTDHVVARVEASAEAAAAFGGAAQTTVYADRRKIHFFEPGESGLNLSLATGHSKELPHALA